MYYKLCPFCGAGVKEELREDEYLIDHRCSSGIHIKIHSTSLPKLQETWNSRFIDSVQDKEIGKSNYGYLIMPTGDIIKCDNSHPEEILEYLDISNDYSEFDYEQFCTDFSIVRISEHCGCVAIDIPNVIKKIQTEKLFELISHNYINTRIFITNYKSTVNNLSSLNDVMLYLDKLL